MCDLKAGRILKASPEDLVKAQLVGSLFGAFIASSSYALLTRFSLTKPGITVHFELPSAHMWLEAAKLSLGKGLPEKAMEVSIWTAVVFVTAAGARSWFENTWWAAASFPRGISLAIGKCSVFSPVAQARRLSCVSLNHTLRRNVQCTKLDSSMGDWRSHPLLLVQVL